MRQEGASYDFSAILSTKKEVLMKLRLLILGALLTGCSLANLSTLTNPTALTAEAIMLVADQNHDVAIDVSEFSKIKLATKSATAGTAITATIFALYDKDGNLKLDMTELIKLVEDYGVTSAELLSQ